MVKSKEDLKKALAETFNEMTRFTEVTSESTPEDLSDTLARMICNKTSRQDVNEMSSQDATSIKGKVVDDSEIGDGKALTYSRVKDKIVYKRLGGGRGGGVVVEGTGLAGTWATGTCSGSNPITTPHGLGVTPSLVLPSIHAVQPYIVVWDADNTNIIFRHNAAASLTITWVARI